MPSVRVPVPSAASGIGGAAGGALVGVGLDPGQDRSGLARVGGPVARGLGLVGADEDRLHVALELETLERLLVFELVVTAGMLDRALGAGHARHLVRDLAQIAEPDGRGGRVCRGVVAFDHRIGGVDGGKRLRLPFVIDRGRLFPLERGHAGRIGRVDTVDDVGQILAIADRLIGLEGIAGDSHDRAFLPGAGAASPEQGRSVLQVAGFLELLGEVLDLCIERGAFGLRDAGPLDRWDRLG